MLLSLLAQIESFPTSPPVLCRGDFWDCLNFLFILFLDIGGVIAFIVSVVMFLWAGILYMTNPEKSSEIHKRLLWGAIGFVIAILSFAIVRTLNLLITPSSSSELFHFSAEILPLLGTVFAQDEPPSSLNCGGIRIPSVLETSSPRLSQNAWFICIVYTIQVILSIFYRLVFILATLLLLWTGILYITRPEKSSELHKNILFIVIGIVIAVFSFTIVQLINLFFRNF